MVLYIGLVMLAYLAGSLASAVVVCHALGHGDPRKQGSGNPGATNVLRLYGPGAALLTLCGDVLKGLVPVLVLRCYQAPDLFVAAAGMAAFTGHLYPLFFDFCGGKGVATLIGVLVGFHWLLGTAFVVTWLLLALLFRYASLASIASALVAPVYCWLLSAASPYVVALALMSAILVWRHRLNIRKLLRGTEDMINFRRRLSRRQNKGSSE